MGQRTSKANKSKITLYVIVGILAITSITYRILNHFGLEQTSLLFVGIPTLLTVLVIKYVNRPKNAYGIVFRVVTLFLLMSAILLGEGILCVLFAAPIFYGVSALIVLINQELKKRKNKKLYSLVAIPILVLMAQPFNFENDTKFQRVVSAQVFEKEIGLDRLNREPDFLTDYPDVFKLGFPKPIDISGQGIEVGDLRKIDFKSSTKGVGSLILKVRNTHENSITFGIEKDDTHISHWLTWEEVKIDFRKIDSKQYEITWTSQYTCDLNPKWYFEPLEEYVVSKMNEHLINSYFGGND